MAEGVARLGTWLPFGQAVRLLEFFWGIVVSESSVRRQAGAAYVAVQEAERQQIERGEVAVPPGPEVQQLSLDGAMVPLVGGNWGEVKTAVIGTVTTRPSREDPEVQTEDLSYFSRLAEVATFTQEVGGELALRGIQTAGTVVAVSDGAPWIQGVVDTYRRDAVRVLNFPHAVEHLHAASQATWGMGSDQARTWTATQAHTLKHDDPEEVLAAVRQLPISDATDPGTAVAIRTSTLTYLSTRRDQIQYPTFRSLGYPIGSGAVESANKLTVEARLKGSGMHWARAHVNPLLALRTVACADRWTSAWLRICQHLRQRRQARRHPHAAPTLPHPASLPPLSAAAVKPVVGRTPPRPTTIHRPPRQHPPLARHHPLHRQPRHNQASSLSRKYLADTHGQVAVDHGSLLIVDASLSNHPNDHAEVEPTLAAIPPALGTPAAATRDAGYFGPATREALAQRGIEPYIATGRDP